MGKYYHYTDRKGLLGILSSGKLQRSSSGRYGPGVYLTRLSPEQGRKLIARNNWDGIAVNIENKGKVDYAIAVELSDYNVRLVGHDQNADIYIHDNDIILSKTDYELHSKYGDHEQVRAEASSSSWWCVIL